MKRRAGEYARRRFARRSRIARDTQRRSRGGLSTPGCLWMSWTVRSGLRTDREVAGELDCATLTEERRERPRDMPLRHIVHSRGSRVDIARLRLIRSSASAERRCARVDLACAAGNRYLECTLARAAMMTGHVTAALACRLASHGAFYCEGERGRSGWSVPIFVAVPRWADAVPASADTDQFSLARLAGGSGNSAGSRRRSAGPNHGSEAPLSGCGLPALPFGCRYLGSVRADRQAPTLERTPLVETASIDEAFLDARSLRSGANDLSEGWQLACSIAGRDGRLACRAHVERGGGVRTS